MTGGNFGENDFGTPLSAAMNIPFSLEVGDIVLGRVSKIDDEYVYVSTGFKTEGRIPKGEFSDGRDGACDLKVDDEVEVMVVEVRDEEIFLSYKSVVEQRRWNELAKAYESKTPVYGTIEKQVKGGYRVNVGLPRHAFLPVSHLGFNSPSDPQALVGKELKLMVIEFDREKNNVVVSHRELLKKEAQDRELEIFSSMAIGDVVDGKVTRITNFGAFVDIGGVEGLVHVSEMAWTRVDHPSAAVKCGNNVRVKIIDLDIENKRIALSIKHVHEDPWKDAERRLCAGQIIEGVVAKVAKFGIFVRILDVFEGLVHNSETGFQKVSRENFPVGRRVKVKVLDIDKGRRKLSLGLHLESRVPSDMQKYIDSGRSSTTLGDVLGSELDEAGVEES
ncbi:MAG: S1 RNA-binding domain-containing protein [bacterium]